MKPVVVLLSLLAVLTTLCAAVSPAGRTPAWEPPTVEELLAKSSLVLDVRMHKGEAIQDPASGHITTEWNMEVLTVLFSARGDSVRSLPWKTHGGCLNNRCETITGWPVFSEEERAVAFLSPSKGDPRHLEVTAGEQGWFSLQEVGSGMRSLWTEDADGAWTVRWGECPVGGWLTHRTVWYHDATGTRVGEHEMSLDHLTQLVRDRSDLAVHLTGAGPAR